MMPVPLDTCLGLRNGTGLEARASRNQPGSSFTAMPYGVGKVIPQLARSLDKCQQARLPDELWTTARPLIGVRFIRSLLARNSTEHHRPN